MLQQQINILVFSFTILCFSFGGAQESDYSERIAREYDKKTSDQEALNYKLAASDGLFFNHNGIVPDENSLEWYLNKATTEEDRLNLIHSLEKNTVLIALPFLGSPKVSDLILDAGCGAGGCGIMIHQTFGCNLEGVTLSKEQANFGNQMAEKFGCADNTIFFQGNMLNLPKPDNSYDFIWACESTEHAPDLNVMFNEFSRISKQNSRLVIIAWCANDPSVKEQVDAHYITQIHTSQEYLNAAADIGWTLKHQLDLTSQTAAYWKIRSFTKDATGSERFMEPGFASRGLQYYLFTFENNK